MKNKILEASEKADMDSIKFKENEREMKLLLSTTKEQLSVMGTQCIYLDQQVVELTGGMERSKELMNSSDRKSAHPNNPDIRVHPGADDPDTHNLKATIEDLRYQLRSREEELVDKQELFTNVFVKLEKEQESLQLIIAEKSQELEINFQELDNKTQELSILSQELGMKSQELSINSQELSNKSKDLDNKTQEIESLSLNLNNIINHNINELQKSKEIQGNNMSQNIILEEKLHDILKENKIAFYDLDMLKKELYELKSIYAFQENEYVVYKNKIESEKISEKISIINNNDLLLEISNMNAQIKMKVFKHIYIHKCEY
jgi:tetrahydromethanopterin S-methyltransferase subunit F